MLDVGITPEGVDASFYSSSSFMDMPEEMYQAYKVQLEETLKTIAKALLNVKTDDLRKGSFVELTQKAGNA